MNTITRGIRNAFRNVVRTISIVIILGLSIGLALSMLVARHAVDSKISSVKSSIGNIITISPAGARGFEGGGEPLTPAELAKVKAVAHVVSVSATLQDRLDSSSTSLQSAIEAGTLGRRFNRSSDNADQPVAVTGGGADGGAAGQTGADGQSASGAARAFTPPVIVVGVDDPATASLQGGGSVKVTSGTAFAAGSSDNVAVVGKSLAAKNNLSVGSTFTAYGATVKVVAIYDAGNTFSNAGLVMPLAAVQTLSQQPGSISSATARVDSISNLASTTAAVQAALGSAADVTNQQDTSEQALAPLESIQNITLFSLVGAVAAGAVIILLTMVMIVRERRREIGILKAIGASNLKVMWQFMVESVTLTLLGAAAGLALGVVAAGPLTNLLVTTSTSAAAQTGGLGGGPGGGGGRVLGRVLDIGGQGVRQVQAVVTWDILLWGVLAAVVIAALGSALPSWLISKVRPAEVMRAE